MTLLDDRPSDSILTVGPPTSARPVRNPMISFYGTTAQIAQIAIAARDETWAPLARSVESKLNDFLRLPTGWDGEHARTPTPQAALMVAAFIDSLASPDGATSQLFPVPDGGIQVEWRAAGNDVEIEVGPGGHAHVLAMRADGTTVTEGPVDALRPDERLSDVRRFLDHLSQLITVELSREQIIGEIDRIARERRGTSARNLLHSYRSGGLSDPGEVGDALVLADLLAADDEIYR